jgi:aryl-alcohol dehydrogenase-like predicted oxidoreductase
MQTRRLGSSNLDRKGDSLEIVPLVFGGNVFGWTADEATSFRLLDTFVDRGFDAIDTANVYSAWVPGHKGGESEEIIGKWFARSGKRDKVKIFTKVGMQMPDGGKGLRKNYILRAVEDSLRRLQTDTIDLYQSHQDDKDTPLEETLSAYAELIASGKVRAIGASNYTGARLREAMELASRNNLPRYISLQPDYNLADRQQYETDLAPVVAGFGLGSITYFSLAAGFLTGKYKSAADAKGKSRGGKVEKYFDARGQRILDALSKVSAETNAKPATIALAWLLAQPTVTAPIASATSVDQLEDLLASVELTLSVDQMTELADASGY